MKLNRLVSQLAVLGLGAHLGLAVAQSDATKLERVEITGSSIKRVQDEGATPVQTIKAADLVKQGVTSVEQLIARLSANGNGQDNLASNQGGDFLNSLANKAHNNGSSAASLRGLGSQYTLVLLNGRRLSTHGLNGQSVDLNSIPLAAMDRVEVLKDGASAVYGADAIGGVINFILKKDYQGLEATLRTDQTQHAGGEISGASMIFGAGDLERDRFNLIASLSVDGQKRLRGSQREFQNGNQPDRGLTPDTTGTPYANIGAVAGTALAGSFKLPGDASGNTYNRVGLLALQGKCDTVPDMSAYRGDITGNTAFNKACAYDYGKQWSLMQPVQHANFVGKASMKLAPDTVAFVEAVASRTQSEVEYTPIQLTGGATNYPAGGPYYQNLAVLAPTLFRLPGTVADGRVVFDPTKPERIRWRCLPCGPRQQETTTDAQRVLAGVEGIFSGWDYKLGLSSAASKANTVYGEGNMFSTRLNAAMATGKINPFLLPGQEQTAEAMALINAASARGQSLYGGKAGVTQLDGVMSKELFDLPAGKVAAAFGFDIRRENYRYTDGQPTNTEPVNGVTSVPSLDKVSRNIKAVFTEFSIPLLKTLDLTLAARYDKYSDFGNTTNPKAALRWQPTKELLLRSSASRGFHAPDYDPLYGGVVTGAFNSDINDPVLCPTGKEPVGCGIRPDISTVANPNLKAETSKQFTFGVVVSPTDWFTASVDYYNIRIDNRIAALSGLTLIQNYERYKQFVVRDPAQGNVISQVIAPYFNLAGDKTDGLDISLAAVFKTAMGTWSANLDGTYTHSYKSRFSPADPWVERVGNFGGADFGYDLKLKWKHAASLTWSQGAWSSTFSQSYSSGYDGEVGGYVGFTPPNLPKTVDAYTLYNLSVNYTGFKNLSLTAGIKNLFDTKPSFSGHNIDNVAGAGWDARVGDPRLRAFTLRANYKFW
jgi:iron complex outermembrane recepter protein